MEDQNVALKNEIEICNNKLESYFGTMKNWFKTGISTFFSFSSSILFLGRKGSEERKWEKGLFLDYELERSKALDVMLFFDYSYSS